MPKYNLTKKQESIVRQLVKLHQTGASEDFVWMATFGSTGFRFDGVHKVDAEATDLSAIAAAGLLTVVHQPRGSASCGLPQAAFDAVRTDFGISKHRRFLLALHELAEGSTASVLMREIQERSGLTPEQAITAWQYLAQMGHVGGSSGSGKGSVANLEPRGIVEAERVEIEAGFVGQTLNFHAPVGAVQSGSHAVANVRQAMATTSAEVADQLRDLRRRADEFADQHVELARTLEALIQTAERSKDADRPTFLAQLRKLADLSKPYVEFGKSIVELVAAVSR